MAKGDITAASINANGKTLSLTISGFTPGAVTYAFGFTSTTTPTAPKVTITVVSKGYDANGDATTYTRTIYGVPIAVTGVERKPYPDEATENETDNGDGTMTVLVSLSEHIYVKDKTGDGNSGTNPSLSVLASFATDAGTGNAAYSASITNNSTLTYPVPIVNSLNVGRPVCSTSTFTAEWVIMQAVHPLNNKGYACIKATCSDTHSHSVAHTITSWAKSTTSNSASGVSELVASQAFDLTTLTQGDLCTITWDAYPVIGDSYVSSTTSTNTATALRQIEFFNNKSGTYDAGICFVSYTTGNNTGPSVVSRNGGDLATARATPAKTIFGARAAIQSYNNTTAGHNDLNGGIIYLMEDNHGWCAGGTNENATPLPSAGAEANTDLAELLIAPDPIATAANVVVNHLSYWGQRQNTIKTDRVRVQGVTFTGWTNPLCKGQNDNTDLIVFEDCTINESTSQSITDQCGASAFITCTLTTYSRGFQPSAGTVGLDQVMLVRGCSGSTGASVVHFWSGNSLTVVGASTIIANATNVIEWCNKLLFTTGAHNWSSTTAGTSASNILIGNSLMEFINPTGAAGLQVFADGNKETVANTILIGVTAVGNANDGNTNTGRNNLFYNQSATENPAYTDCRVIGIVARQGNVKTDIFADNATCVNNWDEVFGVGWAGNIWGASATQYPEFPGLYSVNGSVTFNFTDANDSPSGGGGGDYTPTSGSTLISRIPATKAFLLFDVVGNPRLTDGTGAAGAYEVLSLPTATITSPTTGTSYNLKHNITFTGAGTDPQDGSLTGASLAWSSSLDGSIGTGASLTTASLRVGTHTITLTATDAASNADTETITVTIKRGPGLLDSPSRF